VIGGWQGQRLRMLNLLRPRRIPFERRTALQILQRLAL
jgi:hypothetical protein